MERWGNEKKKEAGQLLRSRVRKRVSRATQDSEETWRWRMEQLLQCGEEARRV
jgi:hypothetical protein